MEHGGVPGLRRRGRQRRLHHLLLLGLEAVHGSPVPGQGVALGCGEVAAVAAERFLSRVRGPPVVVEACALRERLGTVGALVGPVSGVHAGVRLQRGRLPERLPAHLAAKGPGAGVTAHVRHQRGLLSKSVRAQLAGERTLVGVAPRVVPQMHARLERLGADGALEVAAALLALVFAVHGSHVCLQTAGLAEVLAAQVAPGSNTYRYIRRYVNA